MASSSTPLTPQPRKTTRQKKPSLKAIESLNTEKLTKSGFIRSFSRDDSEEEFEPYINTDFEKPKLIHENEIVHGDEIYKFQKRKPRDGLAQKVAETCNLKTPKTIRRKTKSHIAKILEDSDSEYEISEEESSSESSGGEIESSSSSEENLKSETKGSTKLKFNDVNILPTKSRSREKYTIKTDEYFENCASNKIQTSNNTLDKLETPRLPQYQLQKLLQSMKLPKQHQEAIEKLSNTNASYFKKWLYLLNENFNILLYGLGSKRNILNKFHMDHLKNLPVIVVNGFFPTLTIKNILDGIIVELLELEDHPANLNEACELIIQEFEGLPETHLYLIIHNIEGEMIRNGRSQNILARLAAVKNIHLISSIDHINAPLIWDHNKLSKFNYIWWDVTSYLPYLEETSFESSMMVQQTGALALSSLRNVFLSLTTNSKSIYTIIVKHQLDNAKNKYYQGFAFKDLYMACRESFIVSSDLALRAQLTEFVDHKMVKLKRSVDGTEYLLIPLSNSLLQKFLDENL